MKGEYHLVETLKNTHWSISYQKNWKKRQEEDRVMGTSNNFRDSFASAKEK